MLSVKEKQYAFGSFQVDPIKRLLLKEGQPVPLPAKAFDTLLVLLEYRGSVVERNELMAKLWPDTFVEEINLNVHISALRKALGESPTEHRYIVTVPRRGYSFVAEVTQPEPDVLSGLATALSNDAADSLPETVEPASLLPHNSLPAFSRYRKLALAITIGLLVVALALWAFSPTPPPAVSPTDTSLAVLPFKQLSSATDNHLGLAMADALVTKLSNLSNFVVRPTSAVLPYDAPEADALEAGRRLKVALVLEGKLQYDAVGQQLRVSVQMLRVNDGESLWAESFDEPFTNIFAVQDSIARRVADVVSLKLNEEEKARLIKRYTDNSEAYQAYIRGRYFWNKRSKEGLEKAVSYFRQAIGLDPSYALAYAGLADSYSLLYFQVMNPAEILREAKKAALKAVELDDSLVEAHTSLAFLLTRFEWDWAQAQVHYEYALSRNPQYLTARYWYAGLLTIKGEPEAALAELNKAREADPLSPAIHNKLGWTYFFAHRYDEALREFHTALELQPDSPSAHEGLMLSYEQKEMLKEALAEYDRHLAKGGVPDGYLAVRSGNRQLLKAALDTYQKDMANRTDRSFEMGLTQIALGNHQAALQWLEQAFQNRNPSLPYIKVDPRFAPLHQEARFRELLNRLQLTR